METSHSGIKKIIMRVKSMTQAMGISVEEVNVVDAEAEAEAVVVGEDRARIKIERREIMMEDTPSMVTKMGHICSMLKRSRRQLRHKNQKPLQQNLLPRSQRRRNL